VQTVSGGTNWKQVACTIYNTAAIKTDGTLWTWGYNVYGILGTNDITTRSSPIQTVAGGTNWKQVACGVNHIGAIKTDGTLWMWGRNINGQLGTNDVTQRSSPIQTVSGGTNWKQVSCGAFHTRAIKTDGTLWMWGYNTNGELGTNDITDRSSPIQTVAGGANWKQFGFGVNNCAVYFNDADSGYPSSGT
jgi:alpha-tubulin suppressor-like RCC1 family protein